jgi:cellulose synthase/poly-beta-1,6-N-acetylglucosamine synthase-like glycosyltransferase
MRLIAEVSVTLLFVFDFQNLLAWWRHWTVRVPTVGEGSDDFTVIVPVFGHPRYFANAEALAPFREHVILALEISSHAVADLADQAEADGWRVVRVSVAEPNPTKLIRAVLPAVETRFVLRIDGDTVPDPGLDRAVAALDRANADIASIRCEALYPRTFAAHLQNTEYRIAMLSRRYRPWLTSGAGFVARSDCLKYVLALHSHWPVGEDIETGRIALALGMKIRHLDYVVRTSVPPTWRALYRQRLLWWAGNFRHVCINFDRNIIQLPAMTLYYALGAWVAIYYHVWSLVALHAVAIYAPIILGAYLFITVVSNLQVLSIWMLLFPIYAMIQTAAMPFLGMLTYAGMARRSRNLGRYKFARMRTRRYT